MKRHAIWFFALMVLAVRPASVWALTVTPGRTQIRLAPGSEREFKLSALNSTAKPVHVTLSTKDWFVLEANKAKGLSIEKWLELKGPEQFSLKPNETREVTVKAKCPPNSEGDLVGMVSFLYEGEQAAMVTPMISVSVYVEAEGTAQVSGEIVELVARRWQNQIQAAALVRATGNVHLRPSGTIAIQTAAGKEVATYPIKEAGPAYPGRDQAYFAQLPGDLKLEPGRYLLKAALTYRDLQLKAERPFRILKDGDIEMPKKK